jgi:extracellular elastinolytic metalloproteinase
MVFTAGLSAAFVLSATGALAKPTFDSSRHGTHREHVVARGVKINSFHPAADYKTFGEGLDLPPDLTAATPKDAATAFVSRQLKIDPAFVGYRTGYDGESAKHAYLNQKINGIQVTNAVANVALSKQNKVVAFGSNFVTPKEVAPAHPTLSEAEAIAIAENILGAKHVDVPVSIEYFAQEDNSAALTYVVQVRNEKHWYKASIDAHSGKVLNVVDFVAEAAYRVVPLTSQDLTEVGFSLVTDPFDKIASPNGWHQVGTTVYKETRGNNVISFKKSQTGTSKPSANNLVFNYTFNPTKAPSFQVNLDAARVNAFYVGNSIHDLTYRYGFTEAAYNFQFNNGNKGGKASDGVLLSVQDSGGTDNANFYTPPDGQSGECNMYIWTSTNPNRDGSLENDIIAHEFTHGVTNRMTGGGTGECLSTNEAGGMGEGWSDTMAFFTEQKSTDIKPFTLGTYVYTKGIRSVPYSTDKSIDPLMYSTLATSDEVHDIGEIWATVMVEVYSALVGKSGFEKDYFNVNSTAGNVVFMHLFIDALAIQPCNPTFLTARDAIIQADVNRYKGANKCVLWKAFANRGLGVNAKDYKDNTALPAGC